MFLSILLGGKVCISNLTTESIFMQSTLNKSTRIGTAVYWCQRCWWNSMGATPIVGANYRWDR